MSELLPEERRRLLEGLSRLVHGENDIGRRLVTFLPLPAHRLALRPENILVRGTRGAGKTALFQVLEHLRTSARIREFFDDDRLPDALWLDGFSDRMHHPHVSVVDRFGEAKTERALRAFWMGQLLRRLDAELPEYGLELPAVLRTDPGSLEPDAWMGAAEGHLSAMAAALDQAERALEQRGQTIFVAYDNLDRLGMFDRSARHRSTGALLSLWLSLSSRYRRMRAKIFLRADLLESAEALFPDASKLRTIDLEWDVAALFRAAVRHMANAADALRAWLLEVPGLTLSEWREYGWMPGDLDDDVQRALVARLAGRTQGAGPTKTHTLRWILNRLQDGQGKIVPRALLGLIGYAALEAEQHGSKLRGARLLASRDLEKGLAKIAKLRLMEMREDWPVVRRVDNLVLETLPLERPQAEALLGKPAPSDLGDGEMGLLLGGGVVLDELIRLGIMSERTDGKLDMPDLYRVPQGIRRQTPVAVEEPTSADMHHRQAEALAEQADRTDGAEADALYSQAIEQLQAALREAPQFEAARVEWAAELAVWSENKAGVEARRMLDEALQRLDEVLSKSRDHFWARYWKASALLRKANRLRATAAADIRAEALRILEALGPASTNSPAAMLHGNVLEGMGVDLPGVQSLPWFDLAESRYRSMAGDDSNSTLGFELWSSLLLLRSRRQTGAQAEGSVKQSIMMLRAGLRSSPASANLFVRWGDILCYQSDRAERSAARVLLMQAEEKYRVALQLAPKNRSIYLALGYLGSRQWTLHPESTDDRQGIMEDRGEHFQMALRINANTHAAPAGVGDLLLLQGERRQDPRMAERLLDQAREQYQMALAIEPDSVPANEGMGHLHIELARRSEQPAPLYEAARRFLREADDFQPGAGAYGMARIAALQGQEDVCKEELRRARDYGQFPPRCRLETDPAFAALRDRPWFQAIQY